MRFLVVFLSVISFYVRSQSKYWVAFTDKKGTSFNPHEYFDPKAIERRIKHGISLYDSTDFPLNESYIREVAQFVDSVGKQIRWFNAIVVFGNVESIEKVKQLRFVKEIIPMNKSVGFLAIKDGDFNLKLDAEKEKMLKHQVERMQGNKFIEKGISGKGVRVAIFDAGFPTVDKNPAFEHIRNENRIIKTHDFVKNKDFVYDYNQHGTMVFSCVAGKINDKNIGLATDAEFLLARTEYAVREPYAEEENWLAAAEWADKNGADIINSSLGYTFHRYFTADMNGEKSLVARAANMAVKKGILVVNAVGNEGADKWKTIITPADADSVLAVGGIDPDIDFHTSFSSYGPSADKRIKPNVCAYGHVIASGKSGLTKTQGTSFSSPLVAGFAACVLSADRNLTAMQLFDTLQKSGDLYPYFDYAHGYGVPQASMFTSSENKKPSFDLIENNGVLEVTVKDEFFAKTDIQIPTNYSNYLFYHIQNQKGYLDKYYVIKVREKVPQKLVLSDFEKGVVLRFHYNHYTQEYKVE